MSIKNTLIALAFVATLPTAPVMAQSNTGSIQNGAGAMLTVSPEAINQGYIKWITDSDIDPNTFEGKKRTSWFYRARSQLSEALNYCSLENYDVSNSRMTKFYEASAHAEANTEHFGLTKEFIQLYNSSCIEISIERKP